MASSIFSSFLE